MTERSAMETWEEARAERNQALKSLSSHLSSSSSDMDCRNNNTRRPTCPLLDTNLDLEGHSILPIKRQVVVAEWQKGKKRQGIGRTAPLGLVCPKPIAKDKLEDAFTSIGQKLMGLATKNLGSEMQKIPWSRAVEMLLRNLKLSEPPAITSDINDCTKDSPAGCFIQKLDMMEARYPEITAVCNRSFDCMSHTLPHLKPDIFEDNKYCLSSDLFEDNDEHSRADNVHACQGIEDSDSTFFVNRSGCRSTNTLKGKDKDPYSRKDSQGTINLDSRVTQNWAVSPVKNLSVGGFKWSSLSDQWCSRISESGTYSDNEWCLRARKQVQEIQKADPAYFIPQIDLLPADSPDVETHQNFVKGQEENTVIEPLLLSLLDRWSPESNKSNHCYGKEFEQCFESREMQEIGEGSCAYLLAEIDRFNVTPDFETQDILCQKKDEENIVGISYYPSSKQKIEHRETRQPALISEEDFVHMDEMQNINIEYNCNIPHWGHSHYSESCHKNLSMLIGFNGEFSDTHFTSLSESVECHIIKSMAVNDILVTEELSMSIEDMLSGSSFTGDTYPLVIYESPHLEGIISHSNASEIIDSITPPKLHNLALDTALWSETYLS